MGLIRFIFILTTLLFLTALAQAQTLVDDIKSPVETVVSDGSLFTEQIKIISASKKIFVLTNGNNQMGMGDFVSLILDNKLAVRALVAKTHEGNAGLKIVKIYSLTEWGRLRKGLDVQIIRGDDSYYNKAPAKVEATEAAPKIQTEDDLYNKEVLADDDAELDDDNKRHIKPDNVISAGLWLSNYSDAEGGSKRGTMVAGAWAYQFTDNWFVEGFYGRTSLNDFPAQQTQTVVNNFVGRLKYNFKAPLYSFFLPYVGFQSQTVSSPRAGDIADQVQKDKELRAVDRLRKQSIVVGVTFLRRLVPGWFFKADLGMDVIDAGVAIEF